LLHAISQLQLPFILFLLAAAAALFLHNCSFPLFAQDRVIFNLFAQTA
jgi:hypothetical protein